MNNTVSLATYDVEQILKSVDSDSSKFRGDSNPVPAAAKKGDRFIFLYKYDSAKEKYSMYNGENYIFIIDSAAGKYILENFGDKNKYIFEDFIDALNSLNRTENALMANSIYIIDDAKQREKMTNEFYSSVKKEIAEYQERADYLIKSGSNSPAIMERWVTKIKALEDKKLRYEEILRRELDGLDEEFEALKFLAQELAVRAYSIRNERCVA